MKSLLKKILSPKIFAVIQKIIDKICSLVFRILPLKNRALFFTVRADGKLLDNATVPMIVLYCPPQPYQSFSISRQGSKYVMLTGGAFSLASLPLAVRE